MWKGDTYFCLQLIVFRVWQFFPNFLYPPDILWLKKLTEIIKNKKKKKKLNLMWISIFQFFDYFWSSVKNTGKYWYLKFYLQKEIIFYWSEIKFSRSRFLKRFTPICTRTFTHTKVLDIYVNIYFSKFF